MAQLSPCLLSSFLGTLLHLQCHHFVYKLFTQTSGTYSLMDFDSCETLRLFYIVGVLICLRRDIIIMISEIYHNLPNIIFHIQCRAYAAEYHHYNHQKLPTHSFSHIYTIHLPSGIPTIIMTPKSPPPPKFSSEFVISSSRKCETI